MDLKNRMVVPVYGINWRDDPSEASKWLEHYGNPYKMVGMDKFGEVAIGFGITGAPETFVVGPGGKIVFRHSGPLTREVLEEKILPMVRGRR
jgi:cytochrome c biogenesis protein CcmG/thiol:disulfide interchange protein DsbE